MNSDTVSKYDQLRDELRIENDLTNQTSDLITACKIGLRKLRLAKDFSTIDEKLIEISGNKENTDYFSGILSLEAKRLAFKEEALKCQKQKIQINS